VPVFEVLDVALEEISALIELHKVDRVSLRRAQRAIGWKQRKSVRRNDFAATISGKPARPPKEWPHHDRWLVDYVNQSPDPDDLRILSGRFDYSMFDPLWNFSHLVIGQINIDHP
jgi:hypothetical protein